MKEKSSKSEKDGLHQTLEIEYCDPLVPERITIKMDKPDEIDELYQAAGAGSEN